MDQTQQVKNAMPEYERPLFVDCIIGSVYGLIAGMVIAPIALLIYSIL